MVVYVAGIYSTGTNSPRVRLRRLQYLSTVCREVAKMGVLVYSPVHDTSWDANEKEFPYEFFIYGDLVKMRRMCDAVLFTKGWKKSDGCRIEHIFAKKLGLPVFYSLGGLQRALHRAKPSKGT